MKGVVKGVTLQPVISRTCVKFHDTFPLFDVARTMWREWANWRCKRITPVLPPIPTIPSTGIYAALSVATAARIGPNGLTLLLIPMNLSAPLAYTNNCIRTHFWQFTLSLTVITLLQLIVDYRSFYVMTEQFFLLLLNDRWSFCVGHTSQWVIEEIY